MYVCLLRLLSQYGNHLNKILPVTAMIRNAGQIMFKSFFLNIGTYQNMTVLGFFKKISISLPEKLHKMFHSAILFNCRPLEKLIHCFFVLLLLLKSPSIVMYHSRMKMSFSALSTWTLECMNM